MLVVLFATRLCVYQVHEDEDEDEFGISICNKHTDTQHVPAPSNDRGIFKLQRVTHFSSSFFTIFSLPTSSTYSICTILFHYPPHQNVYSNWFNHKKICHITTMLLTTSTTTTNGNHLFFITCVCNKRSVYLSMRCSRMCVFSIHFHFACKSEFLQWICTIHRVKNVIEKAYFLLHLTSIRYIVGHCCYKLH